MSITKQQAKTLAYAIHKDIKAYVLANADRYEAFLSSYQKVPDNKSGQKERKNGNKTK